MMAEWRARARPSQLTPPGDWLTWLILAGRGWGKTRTGAQDVAIYGLANPGSRIAIVAPTYTDARDTCVEGDSGLLNVLPRECVQAWNRSLGELILHNGARYKLFSADEPERLRGPQHHRAWADELAAWRYPEAWDQLLFGLRLGASPRSIVTTTPRPTPLVRQLMKAATTRLTRGSTFENAENLAPAALAQLRAKYEGTRLGRQELEAEYLDDTPGALWTLDTLIKARVAMAPPLQRVVVAVDPSGSTGDDQGDQQGIVIAGLGIDGRGYVLGDWTCKLSPEGWGRRAVLALDQFFADRIVAEKNYGGDMVRSTIQAVRQTAPVELVTASRGKILRAEPVSALYEQGRVSHVIADVENNPFAELEEEMRLTNSTGYLGAGSPNRMDALVWAITFLMLAEQGHKLAWA
jgi:phage terminase large subunit-like protein